MVKRRDKVLHEGKVKLVTVTSPTHVSLLYGGQFELVRTEDVMEIEPEMTEGDAELLKQWSGM